MSQTYKQLKIFFENLGTDEKEYLLQEFPEILSNWFDNNFYGKRKSEWLTPLVTSRPYHSIDGVAVVLSHLRPIYTVKVPPYLYRRTHLPKTLFGSGSKGKITIKPRQQLKPLLSWTSLEIPIILDRYTGRGVDCIIKWKPVPHLVLASHETLVMLVKDVLRLLNDATSTDEEDYFIDTSIARYKGLLKDLQKFANEKEYLVYQDRPITVEYRKVDQ